MVTIVTRAGKGAPLTNNEMDANLNNLNTGVIGAATNTLGNVVTGYTTGRLVINPSSNVSPATDTSNNFWVYNTAVPTDNYAATRFDFRFTGSGGTAGFVSSGIRVNSTAVANRSDFVWGITSVLNNSATAGENVAVYGQANKLTGAGPTWGGVFEARDTSNASNPAKGLVGVEIDVFVNGTDTYVNPTNVGNRVGLDIVGGIGVSGGARAEIAYGSRVSSSSNITADSLFYQAYSVTAAAKVGYDCSEAPLEGDKVAFRMATNQWISLVATNNRLLGYTSSGLTYKVAGSNILTYSDAGILNVNLGKLYMDASGNVSINGSARVTGAGGLGYGTGSGGAITQLISRTTGVTLNKTNGAITLFSAAGSATAATFTVTNSTVEATDTIILSVKSSTNVYLAFITAVAAGSFNVTFQTTGGVSTDAPVINFAVIKAVTA